MPFDLLEFVVDRSSSSFGKEGNQPTARIRRTSMNLPSHRRLGAGPGLLVFCARNLRSTARHGDVQWTDAPYSYTSFSIARLTDSALDASPISEETSASE